MNQRIVPWGTVISGGIGLTAAIIVTLTQIAEVNIPFRSAGPGAVIALGLLMLAAGVLVVARSSRSGRSRRSDPATPPPAPSPDAPSPTRSTAQVPDPSVDI